MMIEMDNSWMSYSHSNKKRKKEERERVKIGRDVQQLKAEVIKMNKDSKVKINQN